MTIDEMLDRVAEIEGVEPKTPAPTVSTHSCSEKKQSEKSCNCGGGCAGKKEHSCSGNGAHKCGCGEEKEHKCSCGSHRKNDNGGKLDLALAKLVTEGVEIAAKQMGVKVVVAIDNDGANLMLLHAMDDSYIASINASQEKAYTAVALKMPTHIALQESRGGSLDGYTNGNGILMLGGGYPLEKGGRIYGGIGVSGGTKEQDTLLAQIGAELFRRL